MKTNLFFSFIALMLLSVIFASNPLSASKVLTGEVEAYIAEDFDSFIQEDKSIIIPGKGVYKLKNSKNEPDNRYSDLITGDKVKIKTGGSLSGKSSIVLTKNPNIENLPPQAQSAFANIIGIIPNSQADGTENTEQIADGPSAQAAGDPSEMRTVITFLVDWGTGYTVANPDPMMNNMCDASDSTDVVWRDSSYNQLGLNCDLNNDTNNDVFGPYSVPVPSNPCAFSNLVSMGNAVMNSARDAGVNVDAYQHKAFILPPELSCGWDGYAHIGCSSSSCHSFYDGSSLNWPVLPTHELLHNYGMHHASTDTDNDCTVNSEYGDRSCDLGNPYGNIHVNAFHKNQYSWIPTAAKPIAQTSGTYQIDPLNRDPGTLTDPILMLRIPLQDINGQYFYVSNRQPEGIDTNLRTEYCNTVSVHRKCSSNSRSYLVANLAVGDTFTDAARNITITHDSRTADHANVIVSLDEGSDITPPSVDITLPTDGETVSGVFNAIANASDNVGIDRVEFYMDAEATPYCTVTGDQPSYSCNIDSTLYSFGAHTVTAWAYDANDNSASDSANINVDNLPPDITPPDVSITSPLNGDEVSGDVTVQVNATDNETVDFVTVLVDAVEVCPSLTQTPYQCTFDSTQFTNGQRAITARAYDLEPNMGEDSIAVTVNNLAPLAITSSGLTNKTSSSADVNVSTNIPTNAQVNYGLSKNSLNNSATDGVSDTNHTINLTGLSANTWYHYQIVVDSADGQSETTTTKKFRTSRSSGGGDPTPTPTPPPSGSLSIIDSGVQNKTSSSAEVVSTISGPSTVVVNYGTSNNNLSQSATDGVTDTNHTVLLSGLQSSTRYYFEIVATSEDGTEQTTSGVSQFRTRR
ncbi:MAG TPA: Ig-like domain-containing protein [Thermodesulfobacteriota bacterium]|nr:Ig-like domain-containing protein [Thermodesulfobacteriota bacterium]